MVPLMQAWVHLRNKERITVIQPDEGHAFAEWPSLKYQEISNLYFKSVFSQFKHSESFYFSSISCQFLLLSPQFIFRVKFTEQTCFGQVRPI